MHQLTSETPLQPLNCVLTMAFFHLLLKCYELGTCSQIRDSRAFSLPRRVLCAFDLLINLRLFGLGAQLETPIEARGSRSSRARPERHLSHLYRLVPPSRLDAVIGHAFDAWLGYAIASLVISAIRFACGAVQSSGPYDVWSLQGGAGALGHESVFMPDGEAMTAHNGWGPLMVFCARSFLIPFLAVQRSRPSTICVLRSSWPRGCGASRVGPSICSPTPGLRTRYSISGVGGGIRF